MAPDGWVRLGCQLVEGTGRAIDRERGCLAWVAGTVLCLGDNTFGLSITVGRCGAVGGRVTVGCVAERK